MTMHHSRIFIVLIYLIVSWVDMTLTIEDIDANLLISSEIHTLEKKEPPVDISVLENRNITVVLKQVEIVNNTGNSSAPATTGRPSPCQCSYGVCGCCSRFLDETWKQKACVNVSYDPAEFSFTAKMWMNDRLLYTRTISGKNPRPMCIPVPRLPFLKACVRLYNIYFVGRNVHACMSMEAKFRETILFKVKLDCMRLGANGVAVVRPEDGDGLGYVQFLPDDESGNDEDDSDYDYDDEDDYDE